MFANSSSIQLTFSYRRSRSVPDQSILYRTLVYSKSWESTNLVATAVHVAAYKHVLVDSS
jgi:hypothetical protein